MTCAHDNVFRWYLFMGVLDTCDMRSKNPNYRCLISNWA